MRQVDVGDGYVVQANLMWKPTVCSAMADAFENADGDLAERLMVALEPDHRPREASAHLVLDDNSVALRPGSIEIDSVQFERLPYGLWNASVIRKPFRH